MRLNVTAWVRGCALPLALAVCAAAPASGQATRQMVQLAKDVYAFSGGGSNSGFVVTDEGVLVFDSDIRNNDLPAITIFATSSRIRMK